MKKILLLLLVLAAAVAQAQKSGALTEAQLAALRAANPVTPTDRALRNALATNSINALSQTAVLPSKTDLHFSLEVPSKGISDQKSSGRCWLFSGLNVLRAEFIKKEGLGAFQFSQSYLFFYDQLEKSNLFLQSVIDNAAEPLDSRLNTWLFENPLSDGGTFCGVQALVSKYGLVPADVFPESYSANNTSQMAAVLKLKLREWGLELRALVAAKRPAKEIEQRKIEQLGSVWHVLSICLGTPPEHFTYTLRRADGTEISTRDYTPKTFYAAHVGKDLTQGYVMLMNDPSRPYYKLYTVDLDRHTYDSPDWTYVNLPMADIKAVALRSLKDSTMMYMSCDVGKQLDRTTGILDTLNYDYASLFGLTFGMDKAQRIQTHASASSHAMTLMAADVDADGNTRKWKVENSWGPSYGQAGHLVMTDAWFDAYLFRLVVERKYADASLLDILRQKPTRLPAWDPLFAGEE